MDSKDHYVRRESAKRTKTARRRVVLGINSGLGLSHRGTYGAWNPLGEGSPSEISTASLTRLPANQMLSPWSPSRKGGVALEKTVGVEARTSCASRARKTYPPPHRPARPLARPACPTTPPPIAGERLWPNSAAVPTNVCVAYLRAFHPCMRFGPISTGMLGCMCSAKKEAGSMSST